MMVVEVDGPTYIFGNNKNVLYNTKIPDSTFNNKTKIIAQHILM